MKRPALILILAMLPVAASGAGPSMPTRTPMDKLTIRLRQKNIQISRDLKAGKLTKDQAKALRGQVETIRKAEIADLKSDNSKTLTAAQIADLNQQLNTLSKQIPIR